MAVGSSWVFLVLCLVVVGIVIHASWQDLSNSTRWTSVGPVSHTGEDAERPDSERQTPGTELRPGTEAPVAETPIPLMYKKNFSKLPQWDFEDIYNVDDSPRKTTCQHSLWKSVENDPNYKKAFIPNIRLFLEKNSINMTEWNRLSHFNNPFGFMEYHYDEIMAALKMIPKPKEPLILEKVGGDGCVRCAVVGTGGILNGSKKGKEIDDHDYVFRMNAAAIEGFEDDVGKKTSVYVHTAHSITASSIFYKKFGYKGAPHDEGIKYVLIPEGLRDFQWLTSLVKGERVPVGQYRGWRPLPYYGGQFDQSRFYVLHQDFLRYVRNRFLKSGVLNSVHWPIVRPTNGAFTLFLALHTCDVVDAYGFMTENHQDFSNYYFQRVVKTRVIFFTNHDYNLEKDTWRKLHESKIIQLYQRNDSKTVTEKPKQP